MNPLLGQKLLKLFLHLMSDSPYKVLLLGWEQDRMLANERFKECKCLL
jgi:hypothetical protein